MSNLKKNIGYNFVYQLLILFLPFITAPYLSRIIGATGVGIYSYTYSIALYFTYFTMLGLNNYGNRTIAAVQSDKYKRSKAFLEMYSMQFICFAFCGILYSVYVITLAKDKTAALFQGIFMLSSMLDINWFFFGMEQFRLTVIRNIFVKIATVICVFIFIKTRSDVYKYIVIMSIGYLISQVILWPFLRRYVEFKKPTIQSIKKHFLPNFTLFIPVIATSIYKIMDKIMLGSMTSMAEVGYFENAEKIINVPIALIMAIGTVMLPRMTALVSQNRMQESKQYISKTMLISLAFASGAMFGIIVLGQDFSIAYYGSDFVRSGVIMQYLSVTIVFLACGNVIRTQYLIPNKKDKVYVVSALIGAAVNLIANLSLIPQFSAVGAAIGTILAEISVCLYQLICVRKEFKLKEYFKEGLVFAIIGVLMSAVIYVLPSLNNAFLDLIYKIIIGFVAYSLLSIGYIKSIRKENYYYNNIEI